MIKKLGTVIAILCISTALTVQASSAENYKIILNPSDRRPITGEYITYQAECIGAEVITTDKQYNDNYIADKDYVIGNPEKVREQMKTLVSTNSNTNPTVIINMSSYLNGGLTATRLPNTYKDMNIALSDLESLLKHYPNSSFYVNVNTPRTKPETRGFYWGQDVNVNGYEHFVLNKNILTPFDEVMFQYSCVKTKELYEPLNVNEQIFVDYFEETYIENCPENLKYNGIPLAVLYDNMFIDSEVLIDKLVNLSYKYNNLDLVISVDDFSMPKALSGYKEKYNYVYRIIDNLKISKQLDRPNVSLLYGYDDVPQSIVARDYTKRTGKKSKYIITYINGESNKNHIGKYDANSIDSTIKSNIDFINEKGKYFDKTHKVYVHNSDIQSNLLTPQQAKVIVDDMKKYPNVILLDLKTNGVDNTLATELNSNNFPLSVYSGWNTIGNAIGLGLAHAQVCNCDGNCKMLTQHIYEDWLYNSVYKNEKDIAKLKDIFLNKQLNLPYKVKDITRPYNRTFECNLTIG